MRAGARCLGDVPLDLRRIAEACNVHARTPSKWRERGALPPPAGRIGGTDYWWRSDIETWWHNRRSGEPM